MKSIFLDGLQYILSGEDREELYDVSEDPMTEQNLVDTDRGKAALPTMREALRKSD